jgi:hypothetical protein
MLKTRIIGILLMAVLLVLGACGPALAPTVTVTVTVTVTPPTTTVTVTPPATTTSVTVTPPTITVTAPPETITVTSPPAMTTPPPTPTPTPTPTIDVSDVKITYIFYDGLVPNTESDEYVEITNLGGASQNLYNWSLKDLNEESPVFIFPSYILAPSESIRVYTNEIHPEYGGFSFNYGRAVWNNSAPDTAVLYNAEGQEVSRKSY